jgi:hypothetical protein
VNPSATTHRPPAVRFRFPLPSTPRLKNPRNGHLTPGRLSAGMTLLTFETGTQNPEPRTQNPEPRTQNPEPRTQNPEPETQT